MLIDGMDYKLYNGDCLEVMDTLIADGIKVDAIITDIPYGTTRCKWDSVIPFDKMWERLNKLIKPNGAIVLFGSEPFTSTLVISNIDNFKYDWVYTKNKGGNPMNAKIMPMKEHENILVFSNCKLNKMTYNRQMEQRKEGGLKRVKSGVITNGKIKEDATYGKLANIQTKKYSELRNPSSVKYFIVERGLHPTQKPIPLMENLIKTYTNENELVLDFTMGSGSTGVACMNANRKFIGIELDKKYFNIAKERIENINK